MKKIILLFVTILLSTFATQGQNLENIVASPGEYFANDILEEENPIDVIETFKENSIGILFMPIPLNIDKIKYTLSGTGTETTLRNSDNLFNTGIGVAFNADFNNSGWGFGSIAYFAIIGGDDFKAYDFFAALKYDIPLGDRAETNFELSPLLGLGNVSFIEKLSGDDQALGNSYYFSGGARITWRIANNLFLGADIQTVPLLFNPEKVLGLEGDVDDAKIEYKFVAQLNLSLRYSIF
jgi:hypothetical protein